MTTFSVPANLAFDTYAELQAVIADWMDRSDLTGSIPSMIALAEARLRRVLHPLFQDQSIAITTVGGVADLPATFGQILTVRFPYGAGFKTLDQVTEYDADLRPSGPLPFGFSLEAAKFHVWPATADATFSVNYRPQIPFLSAANQSNLILANHPDVYFFGAMLFAEGYVANDSRAALFKNMFEGMLEDTRQWLIRQRYAGPLVPRLEVYP
jgi:hypothetical protein